MQPLKKVFLTFTLITTVMIPSLAMGQGVSPETLATPGAPFVSSGLCGSKSMYLIIWPVAGATSYTIGFRRGDSQVISQIGPISPAGSNGGGIQYTHTNLIPGEIYHYSVQARSATQVSGGFSIPERNEAAPRDCVVNPTPTPTPTIPLPPNPPGLPLPIPPPSVGGVRSDVSITYTIAVIQYLQKLLAWERNPVGASPIAPIAPRL